MTPEEVFAKLRDIHLPQTSAAPVADFALWPLLVFAGLLAAGYAVRYWARRRGLTAALVAIDRSLPPTQQRDRIVQVLQGRRARRGHPPPPQAAFLAPSRLTDGDVEDLHRWARAGFG